jgi:hypothetical protein
MLTAGILYSIITSMSFEGPFGGNDTLDGQELAGLIADWYAGESEYQFSRISPEESQRRLFSQSLTSAEGFAGETAQRFMRYRQFNSSGEPDLYPQALQSLIKAANCTRAMYISMLLVDGSSFEEANESTLRMVNERGPELLNSVEPRQLDYGDFYDTSPGLGLAFLAKSFSENGVMAEEVKESQLSLAQQIYLDMTSLVMQRVTEVHKETGALLLPEPGTSSGNIILGHK